MAAAFDTPVLLNFTANGSSAIGYLAVADQLPFELRRVFWTYFTPHNVTRGRHAHHRTEMVIIAVNGEIQLNAELLNGEQFQFTLKSPVQGVYLPPLCWHTMEYSHDAVQLVLASTDYDPSDYIRQYSDFRMLGQ